MSQEAQRTQRAQRYDLHALFQTSRMLGSSLELKFVLSNLLLTAMSKLLVTRSVALMRDSLAQAWRVAAVKGLPTLQEGALLELPKLPDEELLSGNQVPQKLSEMDIVLVIPVRTRNREIGMIGLGSKATRLPFDEAELEFVQSLVHMSAAAVHNSLMVEDLRLANRELDGKVQQLRTLFELSKEFNATVDREHVLKVFAFALMGQMLVKRHVFHIKYGGTFRLVSEQGVQGVGIALEFLEGLSELVILVADNAGEFAELARYGLEVALPIRQQGEVQGVLCLGPKMTRQPYKPDDIEFVYSLGSLTVISIQNAELVEERIERKRLEEELRMARSMQERLLPRSIPKAAGLEVATLALPSREVGGDYFDVLALKRERLLFMIADVTGKGMPAAILMSTIHACTHVMVPMTMSLRESVANTNRVVYDNTAPDKFVTAFAAIYHTGGRLEYVNAGHEPPLLVRQKGTIERLEEGGPLLGVIPGMHYAGGEVQLAPGDMVVLFTDGVTEAMGASMEEYTEARLQDLVLAHRNGSANSLVERIQADIEAFTGPVEALSDDRTLLVLKSVGTDQVA